MRTTGKVENGLIVPDRQIDLPDGASVVIEWDGARGDWSGFVGKIRPDDAERMREAIRSSHSDKANPPRW